MRHLPTRLRDFDGNQIATTLCGLIALPPDDGYAHTNEIDCPECQFACSLWTTPSRLPSHPLTRPEQFRVDNSPLSFSETEAASVLGVEPDYLRKLCRLGVVPSRTVKVEGPTPAFWYELGVDAVLRLAPHHDERLILSRLETLARDRFESSSS